MTRLLVSSLHAGRAFVALGITSCLAVACGREAPAPLPSALVIVDTDVDVPRTISRVRIDLYGKDGAWTDSRDYPVVSGDEWPLSFGMANPDETPTSALVRIRGYAAGAVRDYRGEAYTPVPAYVPPTLPATLPDLCASAPSLEPLHQITLALGTFSLADNTCDPSPRSGWVAAKIHISTAGSYRFGITKTDPPMEHSYLLPAMFIRRTCEDVTTEIACKNTVDPTDDSTPAPAGLVLDLTPGDYTLFAAELRSWRREAITLRWSLASAWDQPTLLDGPPAPPPSETRSGLPRLVGVSGDVTPASEPHPLATIDRLVQVSLVPGAPIRTRVVLEGACIARMSKLAVGGDGAVSVADSTTCVGGKDVPVPLAIADGTDPTISAKATYPANDCSPELTTDEIVCVPGGTLTLGAAEADQSSALDVTARALPLRSVALSRFFLDRYEVTVGRYHQAVADGFDSKASDVPDVNPAPDIAPFDTSNPFHDNTLTTAPGPRERYPLNGVSWDRARDFCRFYGGDLPTEAQWEYAAVAAGRTRKATYPWGDEEPTCDRAVLGRDPSLGTGICPKLAFGPAPVDSAANARDVTALGIVGMGGSLSELTRDAYGAYDDPCWAQTSLDPKCIDDTSRYRVIRGGTWEFPLFLARSTYRAREYSDRSSATVGFRCAYSKPPVRRWSAP